MPLGSLPELINLLDTRRGFVGGFVCYKPAEDKGSLHFREAVCPFRVPSLSLPASLSGQEALGHQCGVGIFKAGGFHTWK